MSRYRTILLDIDGTIVDSNDAHAHAWVEAFAAHGIDVPYERVRPLVGMGGDKVLRIVANVDSESEDGKAISSTRQDLFNTRYLPTLTPTPGARKLVDWLKQQELTVAIATSAGADEVRALLRAATVSDLIDYTTTSDDAEESKPDPDIVVAALRRTGAAARRTIMIGDTPYDIDAARGAGLEAIALRCGGWDDAALRGAVAIFDDPADLLEHVWSSPLAPEADSR
jgi:HAD superfamily hydrolase (TIGR01509 family)